jgi:flagellar operon protein
MVNRIQGYSNLSSYGVVRRKASLNFKDVLNTQLTNHAVRRIENKNISVTREDAAKINKALEIAKTKGSNKTLVLLSDKIALLSVKDNKLITMMGKNSLKQDIFTNIDSVVLMDK